MFFLCSSLFPGTNGLKKKCPINFVQHGILIEMKFKSWEGDHKPQNDISPAKQLDQARKTICENNKKRNSETHFKKNVIMRAINLASMRGNNIDNQQLFTAWHAQGE